MLGVKLTRTENCIAFKVIDRRSGKKSWQFYVSKEALLKNVYKDDSIEHGKLQLYNEGYFDCDDTLRTYKEDDSLTLLSFRFFSNREKYDLYIKTCDLILFLHGSSDFKYLPAALPSTRSKISISGSKNLLKVFHSKLLRKKFGKAIMRLQDCRHEIVHVMDDYCDYSFYFVKYYKGQFDYNGGLIFHKDYQDPKNISKGYYNIHT